LPPHIYFQGVLNDNILEPLLVGVLGKHPQREIFRKKFLVKYCNFVVNLDHSSLGCIYDSRSYVRVFFPRRKPSFMYEGIVLWLFIYVSEYCILREETVRKEEEVTVGML
jgi:hypothetical protein